MKMLSLEQTQLQELRSILITQLDKELANVGNTPKINMSYDLQNLFIMKNAAVAKPTIIISEKAWVQMRVLTTAYQHEVAAHGVVSRKDNLFYIKELLVYPQRTNGSHVESDDDLYPSWLQALPDDTINNLRFQYHSHCNFGVTPSPTDELYYKTMSDQVQDYYIFMIGSFKESEYNIWLYDKVQNIIFEPKDIAFGIGSAATWLDLQRKLVKPMPVPAAVAAVAPANLPAKDGERYWDYNKRCWVENGVPIYRDDDYWGKNYRKRGHLAKPTDEDTKYVDKRTKAYKDQLKGGKI